MLPLRFPNRPPSSSPYRSGIQGYTISLGPATHGQAVAKAPDKGVVDCGQGQPAREAGTVRRGSCPQGRPMPLVGAAPAGMTGCGRPVGTPAYSTAPTKGVGYRAPTRGYRPRLALPPARATASVAGVAAPGQGGCQRARAAVACTAAVATTAA
ncbi:hypothetical protein GW17_00038169 [Ensete ventricosum]|nr:hypothetical protein GW17_00038169 [Ensete ventricosum]